MESICRCFGWHRKTDGDKDIEEHQIAVTMSAFSLGEGGIDGPLCSGDSISIAVDYQEICDMPALSKEAKRSDGSLERDVESHWSPGLIWRTLGIGTLFDKSLERDDVVGGASDIDVNEDPISKDYESLSPAMSRDLLKKDFKESLVLDSDVETD